MRRFALFVTLAWWPITNAYVTQDDPAWPSDSVWDADLRSKLSPNAKLTLVSRDINTYANECEVLGDDPYALSAGGNGICMQSHYCARQYCQYFPPEESASNVNFDLPAATVDVRTPEDIGVALQFANTHNIAVTIKTTGHSYTGSSTGKDTLLIWMYNYPKDDTIKKNYVNSCGETFDTVIAIGGGENFDDVMEAVKSDYHIVTGFCRTVSAAGGWLQGVGISHTNRAYGYGVDQVVDFSVVLANGTEVMVDACSEPDLFWALRGGGGGTFGVVTGVHYKLHPKTGIVSLYWEFVGSDFLERQFLSFWARNSITFDNRWGGAWYKSGLLLLYTGTLWEALFSPFVWRLTMFWMRNFNPVMRLIHQGFAIAPILALKYYPSWYDFHGGAAAHQNPDLTTRTGFNDWFAGARILTRDIVEDRFDEVVDILATLPSTTVAGYVIGGATNDVDPDATALHPIMRRALWAFELPTPEDYVKFFKLFPNNVTGSSFNHHSALDIAWRNALWGDNYPRLLEIKQKYDPENRFNCWHCVGWIGEESEYPLDHNILAP